MIRRRGQRGSAILSMVMSLVIIAILSGMYLNGGGGLVPKGTPYMVSQIHRTRDAVCSSNINAVRTNLMMAQMDAGPNMSPEAMQRAMSQMRPCPSGGRYVAVGDQVVCTLHTSTPKFSELLGV